MESAPNQDKKKTNIEIASEKLANLHTEIVQSGQQLITLVESINYSERTPDNPNWQKVEGLIDQYSSISKQVDETLNQFVAPE